MHTFIRHIFVDCKQRIIDSSIFFNTDLGKLFQAIPLDELASHIQRTTVPEGSFGNEKNHYLLQKVKARNQLNEVGWIFFGIFTCNAVQIARRMQALKIIKHAA